MRTYILTDIHGNNELFRNSLKQVGLKKADRLIILGDILDRGKDSKGVLDTIFLLKESGFNIECLMGNHEKMFLDATLNTNNLNQWLLNGGDKTLTSFLTKSIEKIPIKYIELIQSFKYFLELDNYIFVHAGLNMNIADPFSDLHTILWEREPFKLLNKEWLADRIIIHGHNPQSKIDIMNAIESRKSIICIDNGTYLKKENYGSLCLLELEQLKLHFCI